MPSSRKLELLLVRLCRAMEQQVQATQQQAEAIDRLAASNEALVIALLEDQDAPAEDEERELDLSGRPLLDS